MHFIKKKKPSIGVIHIDTSAAEEEAWKRIKVFALEYDRLLFSNKDFINQGIPREKIVVFAPAIDPLDSKQEIVPQKNARKYLSGFGILPEGPLLVQVSRFDVWKNPHGVVEAFWLIEKKYPKAMLVLVGFQEARDNPEAEKVFMDIRAMVGKDS